MSIKQLTFLLIIYCSFAFAQKADSLKTETNTSAFRDFKSLTFNGIWSWFSDPRATYFEGNYKRTYTGWVDNYGDIHVAYYDHTTKSIHSKVVYDNLEIDDHNNPSILIDKNGYLLVFFNAHSQNGKPLYLIKSSKPENIDNWHPIKALFLNDSSYYKNAKILNHTYTNPIMLSAEQDKIFLFWRGVNNKPTYATSIDNGNTWSHGRILFEPNEEGTIRVPYTKVSSDGVSKIHFTFTDGHPTKEKSNALYYMYYDAGSFYKANGEKVKTIEQLPIKQDEIDLVFKDNSQNNNVWNWDIAENKAGKPIIVYAKFPDNENHIYSYAIWKNNKWNNYDLINSGNSFVDINIEKNTPEPNYSGGITIDHSEPNILYLSVKKEGVFEIEKWITVDDGETWKVKNITNNSIKNNIRPFVVRHAKKENSPNLLWIQSTTYNYYSLASKKNNSTLNFNDRYQTAIKMNIKYPEINHEFTKENLVNITRELLDWQLEKPTNHLKNTNYKYGLFLDGIEAYYFVTKENRYRNEILNKFQYEQEEDNETLEITDQIWYYNNSNNRLFTKKINGLTTDNIKTINKDIRLITLSKLIRQINEDDNIEKSKLIALQLEYLNDLLSTKTDIIDYSNTYNNMLSVYNIAKAVNDCTLSIIHKDKIIKSWFTISEYLIKNKQKNLELDIGLIGAYLLASKEVYKLLDE